MTYYISPSGSDSNNGSASAPFATIQRGVDAANPGDTIVADGVFGPRSVTQWPININKSGTASEPITLRAAQKGSAILDGQDRCHSWIQFMAGSAWWGIDGFEIRNTLWGGVGSNAGGGKGILIQNCHIHHIGNRSEPSSIGITGIYTDAAAVITLDGNLIHDIGRTNDPGNSYDHGVYSHGNMTIANHVSYAMRSGWHIQTAAGFQGLIANCTFYGPNMYAGKQGQIMLWDVQGGPVKIQNCIFALPNGPGVVTYALTSKPGSSINNNLLTSSAVIDSSSTGIAVMDNTINTDPRLVSPGSGNFQLQSNSPAINAGITIPQASPDFAGVSRPQGAAYCLGAYEYVPPIAKFTGARIYQDDVLVMSIPGPLLRA